MAAGTQCAADADFAGAFEHRGEHDIHNADTADQQRDAGDAAHDDIEDLLGLLALA